MALRFGHRIDFDGDSLSPLLKVWNHDSYPAEKHGCHRGGKFRSFVVNFHFYFRFIYGLFIITLHVSFCSRLVTSETDNILTEARQGDGQEKGGEVSNCILLKTLS